MKLLRSLSYTLFPFLLLFIFWELFSRTGIVNPALISSPSEIFSSLKDLLMEKNQKGYPVLLVHIYSSLYRLFFAFGIATFLGITLGLLIGINEHAYRFFYPLITITMPIPGIAWAPIIMLWLGFGNPTIIMVGIIASFFPILHNMVAGVRSIKKEIVWSAKCMGADKKTILFKILLPWSAPFIFTGLKLGLARGWRTIIAVEMIAASLWGLGFMIFDARDYLQPSIIYGGIIILALIYLLLENLIFNQLEKHTIKKWDMVRGREI